MPISAGLAALMLVRLALAEEMTTVAMAAAAAAVVQIQLVMRLRIIVVSSFLRFPRPTRIAVGTPCHGSENAPETTSEFPRGRAALTRRLDGGNEAAGYAE